MSRETVTQSKISYSLQELHSFFITAKHAEGLRERTIRDHIRHFRYVTTWLDKNGYQEFLNGDIDILTIRKYIEYMKSNIKVSPITINVRLRTLRCFLKFLFDEGYKKENFAAKIKLMKTDKDTIKIMTTEQIQALLNVIDIKNYTGYRDYTLIFLLIDSGMRIQEACSLTYDQIDFSTSVIYLQASSVKTRTGRHIPISPKVSKLLFNLVEENKKAFNVKEVFLSVYGTPFLKTSFRKRINAYKTKAGIEGCRVSPHSFRHFFAKNYILGGGDAFTLQRILGHADMQMIRKYINMGEIEVKMQHNRFSPVQQFKF